MNEDAGALLGQCVAFVRLLRGAGLPVTPAQAVDLAHALAFVDVGARQDFRLCAQSILVSRPEHRARFDELFDLFWRRRETEIQLPLRANAARRQPIDSTGRPVSAADDVEDTADAAVDRTATSSAIAVLRHKDFAALDRNERAAIHRLMTQMRWRIAPRRSRRFVDDGDAATVDLRRTLRHSLRTGGEALILEWRRRKQKPRPVVVLCDVSGSMQQYSRILLQFLYVLGRQARRVEAFVFSTQLSRITRQLRDGAVDAALSNAMASASDWGGGTRIGAAIRRFNVQWARRVLGQGAVVLVVSDGWERGDVALLGREMALLHRLASRLIWLNPLSGAPDYQPLVRGMQAALPHVDHFLPVHNLASLEQLACVLEEL